jgi:cobalt/nickel transport system permease protein
VHIPDGFFDGPTSLAAGAVSLGVLAVCTAKARDEDDDGWSDPLTGLVAAFVFAVQMLNFPVAAGTSGHLFGGALAAVLVGPWRGAIAVTVVVGVQALFADGGLSALGLNVLLIAVLPALAGYSLFRSLQLASAGRLPIPIAAGVAAGVTVPLSAVAFSLLYRVGGAADIAFGPLLAAMTGVHLLIGIGEGIITGLVVGAVLASRPDLVFAARSVRPAVLAP